jgi:hypothetical protein
LLKDSAYVSAVAASGSPFDLFLFVASLQSFLRREDVMRGILSGTIRSLDDLNPLAGAAVSQAPDHEDPT